MGEIVLYNISADGKRCGYDLDVLDLTPSSTNINLCGGASRVSEINELLELHSQISFSAGTVYSLLPNNSVFLKYDRDLL